MSAKKHLLRSEYGKSVGQYRTIKRFIFSKRNDERRSRFLSETKKRLIEAFSPDASVVKEKD